MSDRLSNVIRRKFVDYFTLKHNHKFVPSSPVIPNNDKTLSFVNAGMNQFKSAFIEDSVKYQVPRICNYQKCIRVGGKLGDLEHIGHDFRHHTFFEMLGNWSFNDYGKQESCEWALDFLVNHLNLDQSKITTTYLASAEEEDLETKNIWLKLGIPAERILGKGPDENFWEMGEHGPCGPSSEIFYPIGERKELLEIWNLVFIDRQRLPEFDETVPLKSKFVDTGMGLERILSVIEKVESNYDTDLFRDHIKYIEAKSNVESYGGSLTDELDINYRILADHCRMITIALADGIEPGRKGNEFVVRSMIKKCVLISRDIFEQSTPRYLLFDLIQATTDSLCEAYPELAAKSKELRRIIAHESKRYLLAHHNEEIRERGKDFRNIKQFLKMKPQQPGQEQEDKYCLHGRVANFRSYKKFHFLDLVDGSTIKPAQVIVDKKLLDKPELGSYLSCKGQAVESKGGKQAIEFKVEKIIHLGSCDPELYPLATIPDKVSSANALRRNIHLRPRSSNFASILRIRSELEWALHMIMRQMDFMRVHTPILTSNDSEASSDLFTIQRSKSMGDSGGGGGFDNSEKVIKNEENNNNNQDDHDDADQSDDEDSGYVSSAEFNRESGFRAATNGRAIRRDYFDKDVFLTTSAQLHLECLAASLNRVYTLSPAFRAENSQTRRHLCEFLMFEAEEANVFELEPLMDRVETIIKFVAQYLMQVSEYKVDLLELIENNSNGILFEKLSSFPFVRLSYRQALNILREKLLFSDSIEYGCDISREHEQKLLEYHNNVPIFITNYPKRLKPFYMKSAKGEALCFDLIGPFGGELCGGSLREDNPDKLLNSIMRCSTDDTGKLQKQLATFNWYLETRSFGSFPHGGFGIGFERLLQALLGIKNIRDTTPFPRWSGKCPM